MKNKKLNFHFSKWNTWKSCFFSYLKNYLKNYLNHYLECGFLKKIDKIKKKILLKIQCLKSTCFFHSSPKTMTTMIIFQKCCEKNIVKIQ